MSSTYTGNPASTESPAYRPLPGTLPVATLPSDGDADNAASVAQAFKVEADYIAGLMMPGRTKLWRVDYTQVYAGAVSATSLTAIPSYPHLFYAANGSGSVVDLTDSGAMGSTAVTSAWYDTVTVLTAGTSSGKYANISSTKAVFNRSAASGMQLQWEQEVSMGNPANGVARFGLTDSTTALTNFLGIKSNGSGNQWQLVTSAGSTNLGTIPASNRMDRFRVVYYGAATPAGVANTNTALVEVWINDTLAATVSGAFLTAGGPLFYAVQDARAVDVNGCVTYFGGWTLSWNAW